jgi:hypothetical protein
MSEGQSQRSVVSSVQHRQQAEIAAAEERERAAAEAAATAARAAMAELAAARAEVEAVVAVDATRVAAAELEALCASSTGNSISANDDRDNEFKLARDAAQEQATALKGMDAPAALRPGACTTVVSPTAATA